MQDRNSKLLEERIPSAMKEGNSWNEKKENYDD